VKLDAALAAATLQSTTKKKFQVEAQKTKTAKNAINTKLLREKATVTAKAAPPKKSKSLAQMLHIPYIVRAAMHPVTLLAMTKAFWASLFNLNYLKERDAPAQELRSALEEKAKRSPGAAGGGNKGRRQMKRGQAKTLADLPQLST
jgi:hypothetical protein